MRFINEHRITEVDLLEGGVSSLGYLPYRLIARLRLGCLAMASNTTSAGPSLVMIIRHGEKLGDSSSDKDGGPNLSMRGSARAAAVPQLFAPAKTPYGCALTLDK